jgi:hypothetical protein
MALYVFAFSKSDSDIAVFQKRTIIALMFTYIGGLYLYFIFPSWYIEWRITILEEWVSQWGTGTSSEDYVKGIKNLSSFFQHPYFVGYTAVFALSYFLNYIYSNGLKLIVVLSFFITSVVVILAQQRISIVFCLSLFAVYLFFGSLKGKIYMLWLVIPIIIAIIYFVSTFGDTYDIVLKRISTIFDGSVLNERKNMWTSFFKPDTNYILGEGFNIAGHAAIKYGMPSITDGEFHKLLYEIGILGSAIFYFFLLGTIVCAMKNIKYCRVELSVILFFLCAMYGANPYGMESTVPIYWFCAGRIWNVYYNNNIKHQNIIKDKVQKNKYINTLRSKNTSIILNVEYSKSQKDK